MKVRIICCRKVSEVTEPYDYLLTGHDEDIQNDITEFVKKGKDVTFATFNDSTINIIGLMIYYKILDMANVSWVIDSKDALDKDGERREGGYDEEGYLTSNKEGDGNGWTFGFLSWDTDRLEKDFNIL